MSKGLFQKKSDFSQQADYWKQRLSGEPPILELPLDYPRPPVSSLRREKAKRVMGEKLYQKLNRFCAQHNILSFVVLLAALKILLLRHTGEKDLVVGGIPKGNQELDTLEGKDKAWNNNPVAFRTDLSGDPTIRVILSRVAQTVKEAVDNGEYPFQAIMQDMGRDGVPGSLPFRVMLYAEDLPVEPIPVGKSSIQDNPVPEINSQCDLILKVFNKDETIVAHATFDAELFELATMNRMLWHYQNILESLVANPEQRINDIPLLTEPERHQLLFEWNATTKPYPDDKSIHQLFEVQVGRTPEAVALVFDDCQVTYRELNKRANRLAHHLQQSGVGPEVRVGVCLDRGVDLMVSLLGILKAGGAYVPLDPTYPKKRLGYMLANAQTQILLTQPTVESQLSGYAGQVIMLEWESFQHESSENLPCFTVPENLAYVLYTSGSTGHPKGVMISQGSVVAFLHWARSVFPSEDLEGVFAATSICFDLSVFELFVPLSWGGTVVLAENALQLTELPAIDRVTLINTVPSAIEALLEKIVPQGLRIVNLAGEPLKTSLVEAIFSRWGVGKKVHDLYGPSETTTYATYAVRFPHGPATIGRPLANITVYLLDRAGQLVSIGVPGEMYIGGGQVARGYLGRPGLTAEKFVPHPFSGESGARMYRTGDQARYRTDGTIEFRGRNDGQIKVRGYRIELGEIEGVLSQHPTVQNSVVLCREDTPGEKQLVAYVVPVPANTLEPLILRQYLQNRIPDYMVPAAFVMLEAFPLTPNGKVNRQALPIPDQTHRARSTGFVAPHNLLEQQMVNLWRDLLNLDQIGIHDNFFELGGHSLLATRLISRVQHQWHLDLTLHHFFEKPTVAGLVERLIAAPREEADSPLPPLRAVARSSPLPLSFSQQQFWLVDQLNPGSTAYTIPFAWRVTGALQVELLEQSLNALVERHEALRTKIMVQEGELRQTFIPQLPLTLPVIDLQLIPKAEQEHVCRQHLQKVQAQPFDLAQGPLIRTALYRLAPDDHLWVLTLHHIISDGWSMDIFFAELRLVYEALENGRPPTLPPLPVQYADYAVWQRASLHGESFERLLTYWTTRLVDAPACLTFPTDKPRPAVQTYRGGSLSREMAPEFVQALRAFSRAEGVTVFMTLLAAFQALLARHSGEEDIVVGTPVAHRNRVELEGVIGLFLNTLVLRTDLSGGPTFRELLQRVRDVCFGAYAHQELPFGKLVEALHPERDLSRTPLFQVFFNLLDVTKGSLGLPGVTCRRVLITEETTAKFDLTLYVFLTDEGARLTWNYNTDLFDHTTIVWLFDQYEMLLQGLMSKPDVLVSTVSVFGDTGRPASRSTPPVVIPPSTLFCPFQAIDRELSLPQRFEQLVARYPQHVAVQTPEARWTYAELNRQANRIAHTLIDVLPDHTTPVPVGVLCAPGVHMLAALLGVLKTGHPYVPLEPTLPLARLEMIAADSTLTTILCSPATLEHASSLRLRGYQILKFDEGQLASEDTNLERAVSSDALAYMLYTSGTIGGPKGVPQTHRNVLHHICVYTNNLKIGPHDRLTLLASYSFDAAVMDIFGALLNGATLYPFNLQDAGPEELSPWLAQEAITIYHSTPTVYRYWLKHLRPGTTFPALRLVVLGGEEATRADFEAYQRHLGPKCFFVNGFGPTESTISLQFIGSHATKFLGEKVPVGYPVEDTEVVLLDPAGCVTEIFGEIALRSRHLALGYWQRPELTQHAFSGQSYPDGVRQYRTGDMGRYRPDGALEFRGRKDTQVKLRGYRIELGEIESLLTQHPVVQNAVVLCREDIPEEKQLVAYVLPSTTTKLEPATLRTYLQTKLPDYMLPTAFIVLDTIPLTPNGKVNWRALPAPDQTHRARATTYVAPRTPLEELLVEMWQDLLKVEHIGVHDNFFELGGHSLLAAQVVSRVRALFKMDISLRTLFERPTISQLATIVQRTPSSTGEHSVPPVCPRSEKSPAPLSFSQERLWFLDQFEIGSTAYLLPLAYRLQGPLNRTALHTSLNSLVDRHESLRTTFTLVENRPVQVIAPTLTIALPLLDLQHLPQDEQEIAISRRVQEEATTRFDLAKDPLIRATLLQISPQDHVFLLTLHHIITDGWSNGILLQELSTLYCATCNGQSNILPPLSLQYADYCIWQREWLHGEQLEKELAYWTQQLDSLPILALPTDRPRPSRQTYSGAIFSFTLSSTLTSTLKTFSQHEGCTLFMTLLAAFQTLLHRHTGQDDLVVGFPIAGRLNRDLDGVIGLFINLPILRTKLFGNPAFREVLQRVRDVALEAYEHQVIPFEQVMKAIKLERNLSYSPLFQVLFVLQNISRPDLELTGLAVNILETDHAGGMLDLSLDMTERAGELCGTVIYNTDIFERSTIQRMFGHFTTILQSIGANSEQRISDIPLLTKPELHQLLVEWNATTKRYPDDRCIHELVELQVEQTPHHVAVVCNGQTLTYQELNQKANQLAHRLHDRGIGPGHFVPVLMERGLNLVIAYLAIMKTGAAFSPLDPDWPPARITEILAQLDSQIIMVSKNTPPLPDLGQCSLLVVDDSQLLDPCVNLQIPVTLDDPIYVMFTSGSTGKPKGAINQHRGIVNRFFNMNDRYKCGHQDVILLTSHHIFDSSVWQLFWPLINGARTVIPSPTQGFDLTLIVSLIDQEQVTITDFVPSVFHLLLEYITNTPHAPHCLRSLRQLIIGGEAMQAGPIWEFMAMFPGIGISNAYGPTETSIGVIFFDVFEKCPDPIPIGRPLHNVYTVILDSNLQLVPVGIPGDLYVGGACVGLGYLHNQAATDSVFIPNPFPEVPSQKLYKTGDNALYLPDGNIQFLGRADNQVKIRGIRIELGEIERTLKEHPEVKDSVVLAQKDPQGDKYLIGYIVLRQNAVTTTYDLYHFLKKKLPSSMVPSSLMLLEVLPLTSGGKLHLQALPIPDQTHRVQATTFIPPSTPLEELIANLWCDLLKLDQIGVHDNFFELGGHSLLVTQVIARLRNILELNIPILTLFEHQTLAQFAKEIDTQLANTFPDWPKDEASS